jgi:hypothetical protein
MELTIGDQKRVCEAGELFIVPPNVEHRARPVDGPAVCGLLPAGFTAVLPRMMDMQQQMMEAAQADMEHVALIDQETMMGKDPARYGEVCHFSERGTDLFISHVVDFFIQQRLIEPSPDSAQEVE